MNPTLPLVVVVAVASGLSLLYGAVYIQFGQNLSIFINQIGPILLFIACGWAAYDLVRRSALSLWSPVPWFLLASAAYYGFGPLALHFATQESVQYINSDFPVDEQWLLRTNLLNTVGIGIVCAMVVIVMAVWPYREERSDDGSRDVTEPIMWTFLILGGTVKYLFTLPYALGLLSWVLPGSIQHLSSFVNAAIVLLFVLIHRGKTKYRLLLYLVIGSELIVGLMTFSKIEVIMTVLAILLGRYLCKPNLRSMVASGLVTAAVYALVLSPFVSFARIASGGLGVSEVNELQSTVEEYDRVGKDAMATLQPGVQGWWTRLCYTPVQAFVMDSYDAGGSGETFALLQYVFLPRFLSEDKPIMTSGRELTKLMTGDDSLGHTGVGVFGEAYWNGGWAMLIGACTYLGILLALVGRFSTTMVAKGQYVYMPVILMGIIAGLRPDDWFVPTYVGSFAEAAVLYVILTVMVNLVRLWSTIFMSGQAHSQS
jgi:hypothetical protein